MLTCAISWENFSHGFAPALSSPLRKTAPYGLPVHRLGDRAGRSPGSRVVAQLRPAFPVSQWPYGRGLAADSCGGSHGFLQIRKDRTGRFRVPSFVPGVTRGTSTAKCSLEWTNESSAAIGDACPSCNHRIDGSAERLALGVTLHVFHRLAVLGMRDMFAMFHRLGRVPVRLAGVFHARRRGGLGRIGFRRRLAGAGGRRGSCLAPAPGRRSGSPQ